MFLLSLQTPAVSTGVGGEILMDMYTGVPSYMFLHRNSGDGLGDGLNPSKTSVILCPLPVIGKLGNFGSCD